MAESRQSHGPKTNRPHHVFHQRPNQAQAKPDRQHPETAEIEEPREEQRQHHGHDADNRGPVRAVHRPPEPRGQGATDPVRNGGESDEPDEHEAEDQERDEKQQRDADDGDHEQHDEENEYRDEEDSREPDGAGLQRLCRGVSPACSTCFCPIKMTNAAKRHMMATRVSVPTKATAESHHRSPPEPHGVHVAPAVTAEVERADANVVHAASDPSLRVALERPSHDDDIASHRGTGTQSDAPSDRDDVAADVAVNADRAADCHGIAVEPLAFPDLDVSAEDADAVSFAPFGPPPEAREGGGGGGNDRSRRSNTGAGGMSGPTAGRREPVESESLR